MERKAVNLTKDELAIKLSEYLSKLDEDDEDDTLDFDVYQLRKDFSMLDKDLKKINFDMENHEINYYDFLGDASKCLVNFQTLENGFTFLGVVAWGDWETPLFFIIYHDGSTFRGYIPEDGNLYDKLFETAYGSEDGTELGRTEFNEEDKTYYEMLFPEVDKKELDRALSLSIYEATGDIADWSGKLKYDWDAIKADISKRIELITA